MFSFWCFRDWVQIDLFLFIYDIFCVCVICLNQKMGDNGHNACLVSGCIMIPVGSFL